MKEQAPPDRVKVEIFPSIINCYAGPWGYDFMRSIEGVNISVTLNGQTVWEKDEYSRFTTQLLGYARKPFYASRIEKTHSKAQKIAAKLKNTLNSE